MDPSAVAGQGHRVTDGLARKGLHQAGREGGGGFLVQLSGLPPRPRTKGPVNDVTYDTVHGFKMHVWFQGSDSLAAPRGNCWEV